MQSPSRKIELVVWGLVGATVLAIVIAFVRERVRGEAARWPQLYEVPPFALTNQAARPFGSEDLEGKVWVADVIFTSCAGPCPRMSGLMAEVQTALREVRDVRFISITTDPERDTPAVLARYAKQYGADSERWQFLTGTTAAIRSAAIDGLKFTALAKDPQKQESATDLFIHSTIFVIVDRRGWVRRTFETAEPGAKEEIVSAVRQLIKESP